jgi:hypothetical protein
VPSVVSTARAASGAVGAPCPDPGCGVSPPPVAASSSVIVVGPAGVVDEVVEVVSLGILTETVVGWA